MLEAWVRGGRPLPTGIWAREGLVMGGGGWIGVGGVK